MTGRMCSCRHASGLVLDDWEKACGIKSESNTDKGPDLGKCIIHLYSLNVVLEMGSVMVHVSMEQV